MSSHPAPQQFRRACAQWATGIAIVTALDAEGTPHGMTVNSFTSVSLEPPLILLCVDHRAAMLALMMQEQTLAVNILAEDQTELSARFAHKVEDRFENLDWTPGESGSPVLAGTLAVFEASIRQTIEAGDHRVVIAEVLSANFREGRPLLYFNSGYETLG